MSPTSDPLTSRGPATPSAADPPLPPSPPLRVESVSITHEDAPRATPSDVTFDIRPGEVVLLLGPSGSGKSTLALALNGLVPHAVPAVLEGTVEIGGWSTADHTVAQLSTRVAMVFQDPDAQLVTGTVLDEVAFGPENLCLPEDVVLDRAERALRRVGLWDRRSENPERLSGGGRQRLAIAAALAMGSPLLVLDEPTANLDPAGIADVYAALRDVVAAGDRSVLLIEHNLDDAVPLVDRVVAIDTEGRVVVDGPTDVLRERADDLLALGVWLPTATLAALRLRAAGYRMPILPLDAAELHATLSDDPRDAALEEVVERAHDERTPRDVAPIITVRGLDVRRGRTRILHGIDLEVGAGEFLAVVGANGAGKTTLVQAIAGVIPPPRGTVRIGGLDPARASVSALTAQVGFVFQNPEHQFVAPTVADELAHSLRLRRLADDEIERRVGEMLDRFGLRDRADTHPFLLSGGQKRRLSVGTALIGGAPVLALDEPTFGQDRARADELLTMLSDLRDRGTTIVVVTHDMQLVAEHATHVAVLAGGRILAHTRVEEAFADDQLLASAGLRRPPLAAALADLPQHPELDGLVRIADLPGRAP